MIIFRSFSGIVARMKSSTRAAPLFSVGGFADWFGVSGEALETARGGACAPRKNLAAHTGTSVVASRRLVRIAKITDFASGVNKNFPMPERNTTGKKTM